VPVRGRTAASRRKEARDESVTPATVIGTLVFIACGVAVNGAVNAEP